MRIRILLLIACIALLVYAGFVPAAPTSCQQYQQNIEHHVSDGRSISRAIALEDRVPFALDCVSDLKNALAAARQRHREQRSTWQASAAEQQTQLLNTRAEIDTIISELSNVEEDLRNIAKRLDKAIMSRCGCIENRANYEQQLISIKNYFNIPPHERLYLDHGDYDRYFFKLNIGYEYTSISKILTQSSPRLGLLINNHYGRRPYHDEYGSGFFGVQLSGNLILSGATEQKPDSTTTTPANEETKTLGIDISLFTPLLRSKLRPDLSLHTGPVIMLGAKQTDEATKIHERTYAGLRSAVSPLHYLEVLFGHTPGLKSGRMEIRGQMPVTKLGGGSMLYLGAIGNMGVINDKENEEDIITVYISWNIDFSDLFATGG